MGFFFELLVVLFQSNCFLLPPSCSRFGGAISIKWVLLEGNHLCELEMALSREKYKCLHAISHQSGISSSHCPAPWGEMTLLSKWKNSLSLEASPLWLWGSFRLLLIWKDKNIALVMRRRYVLTFYLPKILFNPVGKRHTNSEHLSILWKIFNKKSSRGAD